MKKIAFIGKPQCGKTTIINALAGTTNTSLNSYNPTVGSEPTIVNNTLLIECGGRLDMLYWYTYWILRANIVVLMFDITTPSDLKELIAMRNHPNCILVANKTDKLTGSKYCNDLGCKYLPPLCTQYPVVKTCYADVNELSKKLY